MATVGQPDLNHASFWALINDGNLEAVKAMCPPDFDWDSVDPDLQVTALQSLLYPLIDGDNPQVVIDLASWMISQGADPTLKATSSSDTQFCWHTVPEEAEKSIRADAANESAITLIHLLKDQMKSVESGEWEEEIEWFEKFLAALTQENPRRGQPDKTPIDDSVISMWEQMLRDTASHDIVLEALDGTVGAHTCVLTNCSTVLAAMLRSEMSEGRERRISVKDATSQSLHLLLDLAYTGSTSLELEFECALLTLDLAHRWQILGVVTMLGRALTEMLSEKSFFSIAEAAQLKGLPKLIESCKKFGTDSKFVQKELNAGRLPVAVSELMGVSKPRQAKKRRTL